MSTREFISALLDLVDGIDERCKNDLKRGEYKGEGFRIRIEASDPGSNCWLDVILNVDDSGPEALERALSEASKVVNAIDKKLIELLSIERGGVLSLFKKLKVGFSFPLGISVELPSGRGHERAREARKERPGVFIVQTGVFVRLKIDMRKGIHY